MDESLTDGKEFLDKPIPAGSGDTAKEINNAVSQGNILQETETEHMEVHKHPHHVTHRKKWTEYLLEFFMIFLAVFLGFLAETEREHLVEKNKEAQFMSSMARDLELDTIELSQGIKFRTVKINALDSALKILAVQNGPLAPSQLFRLSMKYYGNRNFFQNSGTLDQLKNSGGLRLIGNRKIVDSIESYDQQVKRMTKRDDIEVEAFIFSNRIGQKLFDSRSLIRTFGLSESQDMKGDSSALIKVNINYMDEYINNLKIYEFLIKNNDAVFRLNKQKATNLLDLIKREYHLE